jgi:hypothetical protein
MTIQSRARRILLGVFGAAALALSPAAAEAVLVTPTALYIDHQTRTGTITLINNSERPAEVSIRFMFGYPQSNETGRVTVQLLEEAPDGEPSAVEWLRAFPQRLVLEPGQRQIVRVMARPPEDLPDGEFWARAVVTSRGTQAPIEQRQGDVSVRLNLETAIAVSVAYRKGSVGTGIRVEAERAELTDEGMDLFLDLAREGNAAFLGRIRGRVVNAEGQTVTEFSQNIAVYREMRRRVSIPFGDLTASSGYRIEYVVEAERPDLPAHGPLPAQTIRGAVAVRGPA